MNLQLEPFRTLAVKNSIIPEESSVTTPVSVAFGNGIGPEIMEATLRVLEASGARISIEQVTLGEAAYTNSGIDAAAWDSMKKTKVLLKAPLTTPQGAGMKSINVTLRKSLGLYANVRPCAAYHPYVPTKHPMMDVVIVRENEEDVYAGIEHRQTNDVFQCLKIVSKSGCERVVRFAFEYAVRAGREKVSCFTKDNIMKLTDGLFHSVFKEVAMEYPTVKSEHLIVDAGAAKLAADPSQFDVIVLPNLYGDILSDVAAEIAGSVGIAPSANLGRDYAMFEAIHGSAPELAGRNVANPSGLLLAAAMMLVHIGQRRTAQRIQNAWLRTLEDGYHTMDIYRSGASKKKVGTAEFADRLIANLGSVPLVLKEAKSCDAPVPRIPVQIRTQSEKPARKDLVGIDVFVNWKGAQPRVLAETMRCALPGKVQLTLVTNRGLKVLPGPPAAALTTDHWRCRYMAVPGQSITHNDLAELQCQLAYLGVDFIKTEHLYTFDGKLGFSLGQGE